LFRRGTIAWQNLTAADFKITDSHYGSCWTFFTCRRCRYVFSNPGLPQEQVLEFYSALEDDEYNQEEAGRGKNFSLILKRLRSLVPPPASLLDIGAASGIFLNLARQAGYRIAGIEPCKSLAAEAEKRYAISLFVGSLENFPKNETYALISMLDVLEHVADPDLFLSALEPLLTPDALLVIVTPDIASWAARLTAGRWWHYRSAHLNFFNLDSLHWLLEKHGFEIILKKRFAWNFSVYYLLTRLLPWCKGQALQKPLKKLHCKLQLFDSWEIYARKKKK
jgi:2-polyprenyl-3-methyl-5-hydroxy-6-metoxy-1,4-benzoquinol methylase